MYKYSEMSQAMLMYLDPLLSAYTIQDIVEMFCKAAANAIGLSDTFFEYTGYALSLDSCIMNHACIPNASVYIINDILHVRVIQNCDEGEELTMSYLDGLDLKKDRQAKLRSDYAFTCECSACSDVDDSLLDAFLCPEVGCDGIIKNLINSHCCEKCGLLSEEHASSFKTETDAHKRIVSLLDSNTGLIH